MYYVVYTLGFIGIPFLYASEVAPVQLRGPICGLSTAVSWLFNYLYFAQLRQCMQLADFSAELSRSRLLDSQTSATDTCKCNALPRRPRALIARTASSILSHAPRSFRSCISSILRHLDEHWKRLTQSLESQSRYSILFRSHSGCRGCI